MAAEIDRIEQSDKERRARDDLEPMREADVALGRRLEQLRSQLARLQQRVGVDRMQLRRVVTYGLMLAGAPLLHEGAEERGPPQFEFRGDEIAGVRDEGLGRIFAALRPPGMARATTTIGTTALTASSSRRRSGRMSM